MKTVLNNKINLIELESKSGGLLDEGHVDDLEEGNKTNCDMTIVK